MSLDPAELPTSATEETPAVDLGYAEASAELDRIIHELDQGRVDIDRLESRFRRAIEIVEELDRRIRLTRSRVDALLPRLEQMGEAAAAAGEPPESR